jgi:hypothetical protein
MATTTPNFGWPVPTSTDLVKDGATAIESLGDSIDASLLDLKGGTSGQVLSKNSNTDMDFTWVTSDDANAIQNAIVDAKGDLITATAADTPARLGVGTNGQILMADSTESTGLKWATPAAGGSMTLLSTTTLTGAATITISSISQSYTNLYILITGLNVTTGTYTLKLRPDSSDANNYSNLRGATVATSGPDYISPGNAGHSANSAVNDYALMIFNYTDTTNTKPFFMVGIAKMASQVEPFGVSALGATNVASAIDSFQLSNDSGGNFTAGTVKIYGVN